MVKLIASLGGYLGRKGDGPPGPKAMWVGMQRMADLALAWQVSHLKPAGQQQRPHRKHGVVCQGRAQPRAAVAKPLVDGGRDDGPGHRERFAGCRVTRGTRPEPWSFSDDQVACQRHLPRVLDLAKSKPVTPGRA